MKWEKPCFTSFTSLLLLANIGLDEEQEVRKLKGEILARGRSKKGGAGRWQKKITKQSNNILVDA